MQVSPATVLVVLLVAVSSSATYASEDGAPEPYAYSYNDPMGSHGKTESSDGNTVTGSYYVADPENGHQRRVDYVADANGFRASVASNHDQVVARYAPQQQQQRYVASVQQPARYTQAYSSPNYYGANYAAAAYPYASYPYAGYGYNTGYQAYNGAAANNYYGAYNYPYAGYNSNSVYGGYGGYNSAAAPVYGYATSAYYQPSTAATTTAAAASPLKPVGYAPAGAYQSYVPYGYGVVNGGYVPVASYQVPRAQSAAGSVASSSSQTSTISSQQPAASTTTGAAAAAADVEAQKRA